MKPLKVMVVDDENLVRWFLDRALRRSGFDVLTADNVDEAFASLRKDAYDLLFVDLRMPDGGGAELINRLDSLSKKPKVVVCSAFITSELEDRFRSQGICILKKPFKLDELNAVVKKCLTP